jgi:hypothetical protein
MQPGYLTANNGKAIAAKKLTDGSKAYTTDCHGLTFGDGKYWIDNGAVKDILKNDGYVRDNKTQKDGSVLLPAVGDVAIFKNSDGDVVHSATVTGVDDQGKVTQVSGLGGTEPDAYSVSPEVMQYAFRDPNTNTKEASVEYWHNPHPDMPADQKVKQVTTYHKPPN